MLKKVRKQMEEESLEELGVFSYDPMDKMGEFLAK